MLKMLMCGPQIYEPDTGGMIKISLEDFQTFTKHFINDSTSHLMLSHPGPQITRVCVSLGLVSVKTVPGMLSFPVFTIPFP